MVETFSLLTDIQKQNIDFILQKADTHHLDKVRTQYNVLRGRSLDITRQNVLNMLMMEQIPISEFMQWLSHVHLDGNNTLFVYEPQDSSVFTQNTVEFVIHKLQNELVSLYDINNSDFHNIKIVDLSHLIGKEQLIITFAAPSQLQIKNPIGELELKNDIFLAYIIIDYKLKQIVLMMHPTTNLASIYGEVKENHQLDKLAKIFMYTFKNNIFKFDSIYPDWIVGALYKITNEYFHHNNPIITEKVTSFKNNHLDTIVKDILAIDSKLNREDIILRLNRGLSNLFENELLSIHKTVPKEHTFEVFLQESGKGVTEYKAFSKNKSFKLAESRELIKLMWENGNIVSLGITDKTTDINGLDKSHPYIINIENEYFSLKKYNTATTEKEVVDRVLQKLIDYKQEIQPSLGVAEEA